MAYMTANPALYWDCPVNTWLRTFAIFATPLWLPKSFHNRAQPNNTSQATCCMACHALLVMTPADMAHKAM